MDLSHIAAVVAAGGLGALAFWVGRRQARGRTSSREDGTGPRRKEREYLELALAAGQIGIWEYDLQTRILSGDERHMEIWGLPPEEFRNHPLRAWRKVVPRDRRRVHTAFRDTLRTREPLSIEFEILRRPGDRRVLLLDGRIDAHEDGSPRGIVGVCRDLTHRRKVDLEQEEARDRLEFALRVGGVGSWEFDPVRGIHLWDETTATTLGWPFDPAHPEVEHAWFLEHLHPDDRERWEAEMAAQRVTERPDYETRFRFVTEAGEVRHFRAVGRFVPSREGRGEHFFGVQWDTTDLLAQGHQLELAKSRLELALRASGIGSWQFFPQREEHLWSRTSCDMFEYPAVGEETRIPHEWVAQHTHEGDRDGLRRTIEACRHSRRREFEAHFRIITPTGRVRYIESVGRYVPPTAEREAYFFGVQWDTTAERESARRLESAMNAAQTANQAKSAFLAAMSHEIRTPMNAILGFAQVLLRDDSIPNHALRQVQTIDNAGRHLLELIDDILDFSKIEAGAMKLRPEPVDLRRLLNESVRIFEARAARHRLQLVFRYPSKAVPPVLADGGKIRQIVQNLLSNAVKFTREGSIILELEHAPSDDPADPVSVRVRVIDTGPGISEEERGRLFASFVQGAQGMRSQGGTGLGLAISHRLAKLMGGDLEVASVLGRGSTFTLSLSFPRAPHAPGLPAVERPPVHRLTEEDEGTAVLVVDDNEPNRDVLRDLLLSVGFSVFEAADGEQALEAWKRQHYPIVLMDLVMPEMDGFETIRRLRSLAGGDRAVICAISASVASEGREMAAQAGADGFLRKPIRADELFDFLEQKEAVTFERKAPRRDATATRHPFAPSLSTLEKELARLEPGLRSELCELVETLDFDQFRERLDALSHLSEPCREHLRLAAERFDHDHLQSLFRSPPLPSS